MAKEICISSTPHETRLAILEDDQLAEIYYERENEYTLAGSIYKGRVTRVLPGMQSAFVDVGLERDAFLYVTDFLEEQEDSADFEKISGEKAPGSARREPNLERNADREPSQDQPAGRIEASAGASTEAAPREQSGPPQRSRGRDRGRGRSHRNDSQRNDSARPGDPSRPVVQAIEIEPFDSATLGHPIYTHPAELAPPEPSAAPPDGASTDEEFEQGTRRWRGRRGRRGGSRGREQAAPVAAAQANSQAESSPTPSVIQAPAHATTYPPPIDESLATWQEERSPEPPRRSEREPSSRGTSAPILLPGESLSKYGQSAEPAPTQRTSVSSGATKTEARTPSLTFRPSTLIEAPLEWDGSGQLPGETISRYRKPEPHFPAVIPVASAELTGEQEPDAESAGSTSAVEEQDAHVPEVQAYAPEVHEPVVHETAASESNEAEPDAAPQAPIQSSAARFIEEETVEEVMEFEPEEASASHRIDSVSPIEMRVAPAPEELIFDESAIEESTIAEAPVLLDETPIGFQSVAPESSFEDALEVADGGSTTEASGSHVQAAATTESPESPSTSAISAQQVFDDLPAFDGMTATVSEPPSIALAEAEVEDEHKDFEQSPEAATAIHRAPPATVTKSIWQTFTELVTGKDEHRAHTAPSHPVEPAPHEQTNGREHFEPNRQPVPDGAPDLHHDPVGHSAPTVEDAVEDFADEDSDDEHSGSFQGFAPGAGVIEEETIDEEEYDYTPLHAHGDDHDLEDLEEETLEHQGGADLGELVREAHLEQRVKQTFDGAEEQEGEDLEEEDLESGAGGFTEDDFAEPVMGEAAAQSEGDADTQNAGRNDNRTPDRNGDRNADRNGERRGGRNRGRRPGGNGQSGGSRRQNSQAADMPVISELLKQGQEILVQIAKEPIAKKGARITSHIALPGRFLVFMPTVNHVGVSRKISSDEERQRLKRILISEKGAAGGGFIVRTAADGASEDDLRADIRFLLALWNEIKQRSDGGKAPALIYHDLNLIERVLRDQVSDNFSAIWVDSETEYERIVRFLQRFQPSLVRRVKLYSKETPLFEQFGIQDEISKALKSKVWLKSGGSIVINQTEALVAIDINTGKFVGKTTRLEDTILRTNLDAIPEIVRQIRLRDLGGIIVIDFIDMDERKNRHRVMQALEDELKNDRAPSKVLQFNDFGLVAITRKRVKQSLERTLSVQCDVCTGTGMVKSPTTVCNEVYTEMRKMHRTLERKDVMLRVHPEVVKTLKSANGRWLNELEEMTGKTIIVKSDPALHPEQFDIH